MTLETLLTNRNDDRTNGGGDTFKCTRSHRVSRRPVGRRARGMCNMWHSVRPKMSVWGATQHAGASGCAPPKVAMHSPYSTFAPPGEPGHTRDGTVTDHTDDEPLTTQRRLTDAHGHRTRPRPRSAARCQPRGRLSVRRGHPCKPNPGYPAPSHSQSTPPRRHHRWDQDQMASAVCCC
jgi:hypothetical protein